MARLWPAAGAVFETTRQVSCISGRCVTVIKS